MFSFRKSSKVHLKSWMLRMSWEVEMVLSEEWMELEWEMPSLRREEYLTLPLTKIVC